MKICSVCKKSLPASMFWIERRRNGLSSRCKDCSRDTARVWRAKNPHAGKERYQLNKEAERERHLVRKYGVDLAQYDAMYAAQNGACAICGKQQSHALDVDHCHRTGVVRGLLCTNCNRMIGHAGDDPNRLRKAADYLAIVPQQAAEFIAATGLA